MNRLIVPACGAAAVAVTALVAGLAPRPVPPVAAPVPYTGQVTTVCPTLPHASGQVAVSAGGDTSRQGTMTVRRLDGTEVTTVKPGGQTSERVDGTTLVRATGDLARTGAAAVVSAAAAAVSAAAWAAAQADLAEAPRDGRPGECRPRGRLVYAFFCPEEVLEGQELSCCYGLADDGGEGEGAAELF